MPLTRRRPRRRRCGCGVRRSFGRSWITFGVIFIGAVHDFVTLVASVRHDAKSIAEVVKQIRRLARTSNGLMMFMPGVADDERLAGLA